MAQMGRSQRIVAGTDGQLLILGDVNEVEGGAWAVHFVPDASFVGTLIVLGRARGRAADTDGVGFAPIPYRRISLNNVAQDYAIVQDTITNTAIIQIPSAGLSVAILVNCSAGFGFVYNHPIAGATAP
jgi:hypothetical protein